MRHYVAFPPWTLCYDLWEFGAGEGSLEPHPQALSSLFKGRDFEEKNSADD